MERCSCPKTGLFMLKKDGNIYEIGGTWPEKTEIKGCSIPFCSKGKTSTTTRMHCATSDQWKLWLVGDALWVGFGSSVLKQYGGWLVKNNLVMELNSKHYNMFMKRLKATSRQWTGSYLISTSLLYSLCAGIVRHCCVHKRSPHLTQHSIRPGAASQNHCTTADVVVCRWVPEWWSCRISSAGVLVFPHWPLPFQNELLWVVSISSGGVFLSRP